MQINKKNIFFLVLLILSSLCFSLSYNFETRALLEATIQSRLINYPDEFNLFRVVSINAWSLPIQIISILIKNHINPLTISTIILFTSTIMFSIGIYLITNFFTNSRLLSFFVSFVVILLNKNFGHLEYPTMMFTDHTNGLMAQALSTLVFALLINNNLKLGLFFSVVLIPVHLTVGLWVNSIIFITFILRFKIYKKLILNKKIFFYIFLGLVITLISFFYFLGQKLPLDFPYDDQAFKTYMEVWELHRTAWGMYNNWFNYGYISKTLILILVISIFLKFKLNKTNFDFGIYILLLNCTLSLLLYLAYKYFFFLFPDIVIKVMPTRFILLHSVVGWPIIFSIFYLLTKNIILKFNINFKYTHYTFILILIFNMIQHNSRFVERYEGIKFNLNINNEDNEFWDIIKNTDLQGFILTSSDIEACIKTIVYAKKPLFICPDGIDYVSYIPKTAGPTKKIIEEVFEIPFNNPKVKHLGGIHKDDLKFSYEKKSLNDWILLKNKFNIQGLIVPKKWRIDLKVISSNEKFNFYSIE
tara:strand:+ start:255 stop:1844 length:1590 start_codon:yes stop_codon:yes gene_type:complete